ncbi:hypothetical protein, partial [Actinoplanes derwentensis]|uniref:hypothetical protein n=1 Tax=Actinoplanes derwentensis TaxID=113562 RepID=UPI001944E7B3
MKAQKHRDADPVGPNGDMLFRKAGSIPDRFGLTVAGEGVLLMGCQVVEASTRLPRPERTRIRHFGPVREWSAYSEVRKRLRLSRMLAWTERQAPHLIGRGHMPGHSLDQLLRDWLKSDGIA